MRFLKALVFAASTLLPLAAAEDASANKVGYSGKINTLDGGLQGIVKVVDATTLMITDYTLEDASAPKLYWWGANDANIGGGFRISNEQVKKTASGETLTIALDAGKTPADFSYVGLWCEQFSANFGSAMLSADGAASSSGSGSSSSGSGSSMGTSAGSKGAAAGVGALAVAAAAAVLMA